MLCLQGPWVFHLKAPCRALFVQKCANAIASAELRSECRLTGGYAALQLASLGLWPDARIASSRPWHTAQMPAAGRRSSELYVMADALSDAMLAL